MLKNKINNKKILGKGIKIPYIIEFSIISRGTEKESSSQGYMAVTSSNSLGERKLIPIPHGIKRTFEDFNSLDIKKRVSIEKIAFSRFQLISAIMYKENKRLFKENKNEDILVIGSGSVGFTTCMELFRQGHKKIFILTRKNKKVPKTIFQKAYKSTLRQINSINEVKKFNMIIDATGNSNVLKEIIANCNPFSNIFILGTPRKKPLINVLMIHRKNIRLIGCHEIIGITQKERNELFDELLKENGKYPDKLYKELIFMESYSKRNRKNILRKSKNIINVMQYK